MTSDSTSQQEPPIQVKYILKSASGPTVSVFSERPSMEFIRSEYGEGAYALHNAEGKLLRNFLVLRNRNGNLRITGQTAGGLESLSTLNVQRLIKRYVQIVRLWPAKLSDAKALEKEISRRETLIHDAWVAAVQSNIEYADAVES